LVAALADVMVVLTVVKMVVEKDECLDRKKAGN
jgi:hypothetical protein